MIQNLCEFVSKIPKSDLHVHLDGSVRIATLIELSQQHKLPLPSFTPSGLNELVFKDQYANLVEYLQGFGYVLPIMQTPENLERISYEFAMDNINEGVCYVEVRFAPQLHINTSQDIARVFLSINNGLNKAKLEYNQRPEVKAKELPEFNYGIIACAMRFFSAGYSHFFDQFLAIHSHAKPNAIFAMASYELAKACVHVRDKYGIPIVALDIAGAEAGNPPVHHKQAYHFARENFMHSTVHAGEAWGPESIHQAVTELFPDRIGHGFHMFKRQKQDAVSININQLVQYIADKRITVEVCLTSNLQTIPALKNIKNHSFAHMLTNHLSTTICTDNRTVSKTNVTKELLLAIQSFSLTAATLKELIVYGFKRSFYPGSYVAKRNYVKQIIKRYELLEKQYKL